VQSCHVSGALIITTPQEVAVGDALRGARMFEKVNVPVFGVIENMSGFTDPETGRHFDLFGKGGGQRLAEELGVPLLAQVPLQPGVVELADRGQPIVAADPGSPASQVLSALAERVTKVAGGRSIPLPILRG
jgi:ATP-binding protein involved in chromosome partitioning